MADRPAAADAAAEAPPAVFSAAAGVEAAVSPLLDAEEGRQAEEAHAAPSCKQWLVLLAFSLNSALNSFVSVNFAVVSGETGDVLQVDSGAVAWFYTGFLLTVAVGMIPGLWLVTNCEGIGLGFSIFVNVSSTWVRWIGVKSRSYPLCFASALLNAAGAWVILPLPAQLSQQRFPPAWWALTTSMAIQANYTGWLLGSVLPPQFVKDGESMERFMLVQALCSLPVIVSFLLFYRPVQLSERLAGEQSRLNLGESVLSESGEAPFDEIDRAESYTRAVRSNSFSNSFSMRPSGSRQAGGGAHGGHKGGSVKQFCRTLRRYPRFGMQLLACGMLGGVSFAFPGCDDALLEPHGFKPQTVAMVNAAFLATGIVSGLLLGAKCDARNYGKVLKTLFVVCACALSALAAIVASGELPDAKPRHLAIVIVLFGLVGMTSLGFIGVGIEATALYPAGGAFVCFAIEGFVQVFGALLNQIGTNDRGFALLASFAWVAALLQLVGYHQHRGELETPRTSSRNVMRGIYGVDPPQPQAYPEPPPEHEGCRPEGDASPEAVASEIQAAHAAPSGDSSVKVLQPDPAG